MKSLIIIMPIGREHINVDFRLEDAIHQTVFLGNLTTPAILGLPLQWLRMSQPCLWMVVKFADKPQRLIVTLGS